jgi:eukaryotic-like serine/threonine-protein kinase
MQQIEKRQIGRYEILEEIGRGAMGVVFKGRDPLIGRAVAVKTITAGVAESADLLERFYREARAAGGLQHPNIVTIYEMAESEGAPFIAMEYLQGESLEKLIARKPALPLGARIDYVVQACRALDYAHRRGVIHRDVKPANIVITTDGMVKVVDFGIARIADASKTQTGMLLGTLAYMSPEQLRGQHADARCDVWALGVVLYELITYRRPFTGDNHAALLLNILQNEPPSIRQLLTDCPIPLERVVLRALRKDDKERYATMEALLNDLLNVGSSLGSASPQAAEKESPSGIGDETLLETQRMDAQTLNAPGKPQADRTRNAKTSLPAARAVARQPKSAATDAAPAAKPTARAAIQGKTHPNVPAPARAPGKAAVIFAILALAALSAVGAFRYGNKILASITKPNVGSGADSSQPVRDATSSPAPPAATAPTPVAPSIPATSGPPSAAVATSSPVPAENPALPSVPALPSLEDQQRHWIDLAHESVDKHDYAAAQKRLDEAAKLNGPLNGLVANLRREFSDDAHAAELQRASRQEQTLWDKATADLQSGRLDDAEKSLRHILTLPEAGERWADAARYVDQVIPQRRHDDQLWADAQLQSTSTEPGHLMKEVKSLDELLVAGGPHQQQARQTRDALLAQIFRGNARRNRAGTSSPSPGEAAQIAQLKNEFSDLVQKGDASALEPLQQLRPKFKSIADTEGPQAQDARDYWNNLIPKAQKQIEDTLAAAEAESSANAAYQSAVKNYSRAVAAQNTAMLRDQVLPSFTQIAQAGGLRAQEAQQYVDVLIPAALKESGR